MFFFKHTVWNLMAYLTTSGVSLFIQNQTSIICSCLLRFCYFRELISYLMSHTLWIKARNKRNLKFRPCSNCAKFVNSVVIIFSFLIFHLGILFMFYFLTVFPKEFRCVYDFFTYMEKERIT